MGEGEAAAGDEAERPVGTLLNFLQDLFAPECVLVALVARRGAADGIYGLQVRDSRNLSAWNRFVAAPVDGF